VSGPREPFTLDGGTVRLRPWRLRDAEQLREACDDPVTAHFMAQMPTPYTAEDARWWITEGSPATWQQGEATWAVVDPVTDEVLGGAGLSHLQADRRQAEVGYWVAPWARRRGVATAVTRAITDWAFGTLGMHRVELLTVPANAASQRVALAAGFTREGVRRGAATRRDGSPGDYVAFVRLATDPPGPVPPGVPGR
jgi:RimJ/RimL family protein N-acetyltransferase